MKWDEILSLIDSIVIVFVSVVLFLEFWETKDGILRKIMMCLFACLAFIYSVGALVISMQMHGFWKNITLAELRWLTSTPLAVTMIRFLYYWIYEMKGR